MTLLRQNKYNRSKDMKQWLETSYLFHWTSGTRGSPYLTCLQAHPSRSLEVFARKTEHLISALPRSWLQF
ncbi:hypothetical protein XELAEV_18030786mg [Xenopus laevis]|uniref:Uncharacterized protein n=1 Tax=Xenopus laevis TaxID=8355 RepID=A0A974HF43_XENLA|nr:hypothetical protein XELAEV_18030786mg [Xenopus laevis]